MCCTRLDGNAARKNDAKNRHLQRAPPIFGRAAITLGIGPHFKFTEESHIRGDYFAVLAARVG